MDLPKFFQDLKVWISLRPILILKSCCRAIGWKTQYHPWNVSNQQHWAKFQSFAVFVLISC